MAMEHFSIAFIDENELVEPSRTVIRAAVFQESTRLSSRSQSTRCWFDCELRLGFNPCFFDEVVYEAYLPQRRNRYSLDDPQRNGKMPIVEECEGT
jgi:hypothetical protein